MLIVLDMVLSRCCPALLHSPTPKCPTRGLWAWASAVVHSQLSQLSQLSSSPSCPSFHSFRSAPSCPSSHGTHSKIAPRKRILLTGEPPNPIDIPTGCAFHPRCPSVVARCKTETPVKTMLDARHSVACHLHTGTAPLVYMPSANESLLVTPLEAVA